MTGIIRRIYPAIPRLSYNFDLKLFDASEHARFCGIGNKAILANFEALLAEKKLSYCRAYPWCLESRQQIENLTALRDYLSGLSVEQGGAPALQTAVAVQA
jgi:pyruvate-formate lyase-activating enzyme